MTARPHLIAGSLALTALVALTGCGQGVAPGAQATLPPDVLSKNALDEDVNFDPALVASITPPDDSLFRRFPDTSSPLASGSVVRDCAEVGNWLGKKIPAIPGYESVCALQAPSEGLPERHGKVAANGEPLEYTVQVFYSPAGVDVSSIPAAQAYARGAVTVALDYGPATYDGFPDPPDESTPVDTVNGGFVHGSIGGNYASVQATPNNTTRVWTTVVIGGDTFAVTVNSSYSPTQSLNLASAST